MTASRGLLMFLLLVYVTAQIICNMVENNAMYTDVDVATLTDMAETEETSILASTGESITFFNKAWDFVRKIIFFDYTIFKNYNPDTGEITANNAAILRYILIVIGVVGFLDLGIQLRNLLPV